MVRTSWVLLAGLLLIPGPGWAADAGPAGTWKVMIVTQDEQVTYWIVTLEEKDKKWAGSVIASAEGVPESTLEDLSLDGDYLRFKLKVDKQAFNFEGKITKDAGKPILGTILTNEHRIFLVQLEPTTLKTLDSYEANKDVVAKSTDDQKVFAAAMSLIRQASAHKAKAEEVRGWADRAFKTAEPRGPRWQREVALRTAELLANQEGLVNVAVEYARKAERLLGEKEDSSTQGRVLKTLANVLKKAEKVEEAREVQARIDKLEVLADQEYLKKMPPFKAEPFAGRKEKSDRAVLVELFTGAECPPCVAADIAFDVLGKTFKPTEVILLQYHLHIPGLDPLTNPSSEARHAYYVKKYGDDVEGTPSILFDGKLDAPGGGRSFEDSKGKYNEYRKVIEPLLEKSSGAKLKASAQQKGNKIDITAEVTDLEKPGEDIKLRLALVEETIRYIGGNTVRFHHHVVRDLPGGAEGLVLKEKTGKQAVTVDLEELRKKLTKYLDDIAKEAPFPNTQRPMDLKNLRVVAFVQNDKTREVLQAVQVEVRAEK